MVRKSQTIERPRQYWIIATIESEGRDAELALRRDQLARDHHAFIDQLDQRGILLVHGGAIDERDQREGTGFIVISAPTRSEAESIARTEPYIAAGFRMLKLIPWRARLGKLAHSL